MIRPDDIDPFVPAEGPPPSTLWAFITWCLAGMGGVFTLGFAISAVAGTTEVIGAWLLGRVIDRATEAGQGNLAEIAPLLTLSVLFLLFARPIAQSAGAYMQALMISSNVNAQVLVRLHRWTMGQSISFFDDDFAGRIAQKQMQTARAVTDVSVDTVNTGVFALSSILGAAALAGAVSPLLAVFLLLWLGAYLLVLRWFLPRIRERAKKRAASRAALSGQVVDTVTNMRTVKLFAHQDFEDEAAIDAMRDFRGRIIRYGRLAVAFRFTLFTLAGMLPILLAGGALVAWSNGSASAGDVAATGAVSLRIAQMTGWVSFTLMGVYSHIGEIEDGMRTLTPPHGLTDAPDAEVLEVREGRIEMEDVRYTYGRGDGGIEGVLLAVAPGEKVGVVGASGAGKTTLVSLLLRLYDVEGGAIRVDGRDLREVTQESLRRAIALVTQETAMFNRSARENILYGRPDASEEEMVEAARRAEAHDFILGLKDHAGRTGYDAHLGERGVKLSGGQRQRIALARAILKDAPILVLDEATSALDSEVEASIQAALSRVMEGKTVLAIAHRLSTLTEMDRIVVLDEGRVVEEGTHAELLGRGGLYARYWRRQSGGFLDLAAE